MKKKNQNYSYLRWKARDLKCQNTHLGWVMKNLVLAGAPWKVRNLIFKNITQIQEKYLAQKALWGWGVDCSSHLNLRKVKLYEIKRPLILNENNYVLYFFCILIIKGAHFDLHFSGDIFLTDKHAIDNNPAHF